MKKLIYILLIGIVAACSGSNEDTRAAEAAKAYYDSLFAGRADIFISGHFDSDSMPQKYLNERIDNAKMFVEQQKEEHRGIISVRISRSELNDSLHTANVFLIFCYGDSTNEEVVVPMVERNGEWRMK
ncbi:MAG: hypothetical protein J5918_01635 [Prevotella sp.]|nr:hypothetical protein [Prevotella sp.]